MNPRRLHGWQTRFGSWVMEYGSSHLAADLGVTRSAVNHWIAGRSSPRPTIARQIVAISRGAITIQEIYADEKRCA